MPCVEVKMKISWSEKESSEQIKLMTREKKSFYNFLTSNHHTFTTGDEHQMIWSDISYLFTAMKHSDGNNLCLTMLLVVVMAIKTAQMKFLNGSIFSVLSFKNTTMIIHLFHNYKLFKVHFVEVAETRKEHQ